MPAATPTAVPPAVDDRWTAHDFWELLNDDAPLDARIVRAVCTFMLVACALVWVARSIAIGSVEHPVPRITNLLLALIGVCWRSDASFRSIRRYALVTAIVMSSFGVWVAARDDYAPVSVMLAALSIVGPLCFQFTAADLLIADAVLAAACAAAVILLPPTAVQATAVSAIWLASLFLGSMVGLVAMGARNSMQRSLTALHRQEAERRDLVDAQARMAAMKARFVTQASHEFRTPLAVIQTTTDTLLRYRDRLSLSEQERRLRKVQTAVRQIMDLLDEVLDFGRAESGKATGTPEAVDLPHLCRTILADVEATALRTHELALSCRGLEAPVTLDPAVVRRVVGNLLTNAVKYSPAGGRVTIDAGRDGDTIVLRVGDQGIGIPPDDLAHLFEPFHRAGNVGGIQGSGLGLAITYATVTSHGGTIQVDSIPGRGTTVEVRLPIARGASAGHEPTV